MASVGARRRRSTAAGRRSRARGYPIENLGPIVAVACRGLDQYSNVCGMMLVRADSRSSTPMYTFCVPPSIWRVVRYEK